MNLSRRTASLLGIGILSIVALRLLHVYSNPSPETPILWNWLLISLVFHVAIYWLGAQGWIRILAEMGEIDQTRDHIANYWNSLPFQFIGGFFGSSLGRVWLSKPLTVKNKTLVGALLIEKSLVGAYSLLTLLTLTVLGYLLQRRPGAFIPFVAVLILFALASFGVLYSSTHSKVPSTLNRIKISVLYLCCIQACVILALFTLTKAISLSTPMEMTHVTRMYLASWCLSQIAFIIPQGVGIREAIFTFFIHSSAGILWPIKYALYARLLSIAGQLLPILFFSRAMLTDGQHSLPPAE
jgi:hypothetical protein